MDSLWQFLAGYLNQDLSLIYGDPRAAVRDFTNNAPERVLEARRGVAGLLARFPDDADLLAEAERLGCDYLPEGSGEFRSILEYALTCWPADLATTPVQSA
jgi:CdiI immunity protein